MLEPARVVARSIDQGGVMLEIFSASVGVPVVIVQVSETDPANFPPIGREREIVQVQEISEE